MADYSDGGIFDVRARREFAMRQFYTTRSRFHLRTLGHVAAVLVFTALSLAAQERSEREPRALERAAKALSVDATRAAAEELLRRAGPVAVPYLIRVVAATPEPDEEEVRRGAVAAVQLLGDLRGKAVPAVPVLLDAVEEWPEADLGVLLAQLARVWPYDRKFWEAEKPVDGLRAVRDRRQGLQVFRRRTRAQQERWNRRQRYFSATHAPIHLLERVYEEGVDPSKLPALIRSIETSKFSREFALEALLDHGAAARALLPRLSRLLVFPVPVRPVRSLEKLRYRRIAAAIVAVAPRDPAAIDAHCYFMLYHPEQERRRQAAAALRVFAPGVSDQLGPRVLQACEDPDRTVLLEVLPLVGVHCRNLPDAPGVLALIVMRDDAQLAALAEAAQRALGCR